MSNQEDQIEQLELVEVDDSEEIERESRKRQVLVASILEKMKKLPDQLKE